MLQQETKSPVETAIEQAKSTCDSGTTQECAAAWDEVRSDENKVLVLARTDSYKYLDSAIAQGCVA